MSPRAAPGPFVSSVAPAGGTGKMDVQARYVGKTYAQRGKAQPVHRHMY